MTCSFYKLRTQMTSPLLQGSSFTLEKLKNDSPEIYRRLNLCFSSNEYKIHKPQITKSAVTYWDFQCSVNCWRFDNFLSDAQWRTFAQLCVRRNADIGKAIREWSFETDRVSLFDFFESERTDYYVPTNIKGWVDGTFFMIEPDGRLHT
jgi:hypothetical protein